jgi:hypothetical protein
MPREKVQSGEERPSVSKDRRTADQFVVVMRFL